MFYKEFVEENVDNGMSSQIDMPDLFHLSQYFRTQCGIIKLAQSVLELLYHFFPLAIDILNPERSLILGESPVVTETKAKVLLLNFFFHGRNFGSHKYEFGTDQEILLREELGRKK